LSIVFCGCSRYSFSKAEREKVGRFFQELLLEDGGAYTLFCSKAITMEPLLDISEAALEELHSYLKNHPDIEVLEVERYLEEGWRVWKKMPIPSAFLLREIILNGDRMLVFMNLSATADVLRKYYVDFQQIVEYDFDPHQVILDLQKGREEFWVKILLNHKAKGILFGYGYKNASLFGQKRNHSNPSENNDPRLIPECTVNQTAFRIPIFAAIDPHESQELILQYKNEREQIKKLYEGRDFLKVTLDRLYANQ